MAKILIFLANGFEEVEALTVVDMLRREDILIEMVSTELSLEVTGSHGIKVIADLQYEQADFEGADMLVIPGGLRGTDNLLAHKRLIAELKRFNEKGKMLGAICAGPAVLGMNGILTDKKVTCYPGTEDRIPDAAGITDLPVVRDGNIITSRGMGTAIEFAAAIVEYFKGVTCAKVLLEKIVYKRF